MNNDKEIIVNSKELAIKIIREAISREEIVGKLKLKSSHILFLIEILNKSVLYDNLDKNGNKIIVIRNGWKAVLISKDDGIPSLSGKTFYRTKEHLKSAGLISEEQRTGYSRFWINIDKISTDRKVTINWNKLK